MLTNGASTRARILAHAVQKAHLLPWNFTNGYEENGCLAWCDKVEGTDTFDALALRSREVNNSFRHKGSCFLRSIRASISRKSSAEAEKAVAFDVAEAPRVRVTTSSAARTWLNSITLLSTLGWVRDSSAEKTFRKTFFRSVKGRADFYSAMTWSEKTLLFRFCSKEDVSERKQERGRTGKRGDSLKLTHKMGKKASLVKERC